MNPAPTPKQRVEDYFAWIDLNPLHPDHSIFCDSRNYAKQLATELEAAQADNAKLLELAEGLAESIKEFQAAQAAKGIRALMMEDPDDKEAIASVANMPSAKAIMQWSLRAAKQMRLATDNFTTYKQSKGIK